MEQWLDWEIVEWVHHEQSYSSLLTMGDIILTQKTQIQVYRATIWVKSMDMYQLQPRASFSWLIGHSLHFSLSLSLFASLCLSLPLSLSLFASLPVSLCLSLSLCLCLSLPLSFSFPLSLSLSFLHSLSSSLTLSPLYLSLSPSL